MRHIIFEQSDRYPVVILIKGSYFRQYELERHYLDGLYPEVPARDILAMDLEYNSAGKAPVSLIKEYLAELLPAVVSLGARFLYVADAAYFKVLTGNSKAEPHIGYVMPCTLKGFEQLQVVLGVNYQQLVYNPDLYPRMDLSLQTLKDAYQGTYKTLGADIIHRAHYPDEHMAIAMALQQLLDQPELCADIEGFSLHPLKAGVGTIAFGTSLHEGVAFACDYVPLAKPVDGIYGENVPNPKVRRLLRNFFEAYQGRLVWHNATYDVRSLIYALWMEHPLDRKGMLEGLGVMTRCFDDTKIIAYLATNSTAGNHLSLKDLAHEFAGNYAQDEIKDIRRIPLPELLQYNLVDTLATRYVKDTYYPIMVRDQQEALYHQLMLPSLKTITQIELVGMPLCRDTVAEAKKELEAEEQQFLAVFQNNPIIQRLEDRLTHIAWEKDYESRKAKAKNPDKIQYKDFASFPRFLFNPNSGPQLQELLYTDLGLPVIDFTDTKQPATGGDTLKKLKNHTEDADVIALLDALVGLTGVSKILTAFIPRFEEAIDKQDGRHYLHGNFNLGGTVSGRLSSSKPNLQQIPANSKYAKIIKQCFQAPKGWIMGGADFNSLEDYISALTTKDPNKLKVYLEGYDGHCLRAFSYFPDRLPGIVDTVESINSIQDLFPEVRQDSKTPTFALTYGGTWIAIMNQAGLPEDKAKAIEAAYHELYKVSDEWVQEKINQATQDGYVTVAFGLRVRTPLLAQVIRGTRSTPFQAEAEARTAGNALGQSYGLLNNRAANAFMEKVWASPYRHDILPIALIHDAIYLLFKDDVRVVEFVNRELINAMRWQELPEIQHDKVKLGAALDLFWPSWNDAVGIPNEASQEEIRQLCEDHAAAMFPRAA